MLGELGFNQFTIFQCIISAILFRNVYVNILDDISETPLRRVRTFLLRFVLFIFMEVFIFFVCVYCKLKMPTMVMIFFYLPYILMCVNLLNDLLSYYVRPQSFWVIFFPLFNPTCSFFFMFLSNTSSFQQEAESQGFTPYLYMFFTTGLLTFIFVILVHLLQTFIFESSPLIHRWRIFIQRVLYLLTLFYSNRLQILFP